MQINLLGPVEVSSDNGGVALGGPKPRALLAMLALDAGSTVSAERLIDGLWGDEPPPTAAKMVQLYVSQLRKAMAAKGESDAIAMRGRGYQLQLGRDRVDVGRFERLLAQGAAREALRLWRGPALADVADEPFAASEIRRLDELRASAFEVAFDQDIDAGRHREVLPELEALLAREPLRERLHAQRMIALYRSGRQAEALEAFRSARDLLVQELGIEPGRRLRELHEAMLRQDPVLDPAAAAQPRGGFVGRERELAALVGGLDDAVAGRGRLFLLAGEPGIGKSRLAEEVIARARDRGARVLVGRCWEAGGAPAYWPWVQSLRPYVHATDTASLRSQLGWGAPDVARLLPELRDLLADLGPAPALEPDGARFRLFDSLGAFLKRMAITRPLVLVLDDLHAADEPSLLLLRFVARELGDSRVLIVGAYRDVDPTLADPLTTTLTELAREPVTRTLALAGLGEAEVARFIELAEPTASGAELAPAVHAETEGNPLFVGEIVRLLAAERRLGEPATGPLAIPQSVREVIGRRLRRLSDDCNRLLTLASVLGREFDLDALAGVSALEREAVLERLDEAIEARVVSEIRGAVGRIRFAHALIRDAAYHRLTTSRRVQLHRQVAETIETVYAADLDSHLAELAHHYVHAAAGEKAIDYARRAGYRAITQLAYEEAVRLFTMALDALGPNRGARAQLRCELLLELAAAQARAGDTPGAKSNFLHAAELARSAALPDLLAQAAAGYGGRFLWTHAVADERLVPLLQDALAGLREDDSVLRVQLLSRLAAALRHAPSRERRERIGREALEIARGLGDPPTLLYALAATAAALIGPHNAPARLAEGDEIIAQAARARDRERLFDGHEHAYWAAWELGDPARRAADLAAMTREASELRQPAQRWTLAAAQATLALSQGRFAEAADRIERAAEIGGRALAWSAAATRRLQLFILHREQGSLDGLEREVWDSPHEFPSPLMHGAVLAQVHARTQRPEAAATVLDELMRHDLSDWHVDEQWLASVCLLAETCARLEDIERARSLYSLLVPYGSQNAVAQPELALDSVSRPLGILATLLGRHEDAARHFEEALRMNERMGARPWIAHTHEEHARMLLRRNADGDREHAQALLARALAIYHELGMHQHATNATALWTQT